MAVTSGPILFIVPARGGSRRIPGKNLRTVAGIPLVGRAIRIARLAAAGLAPADVAGGPHRVVCSTDDPAIAAAARQWGAEAVDRPAALATDTAPSVDVAIHVLDRLERDGASFRAVVLVQPTSPLTEPDDIRRAIAAFDQHGGERAVVSVTRPDPAGHQVDADLRPLPAEAVRWRLTGAFYAIAPATLRAERRFVVPGATTPFEVPTERSVDVDEPADLAVAEALAAAAAVSPLILAGRRIGEGPVFVIAEAGVNHNGDPDLAHRLVDAAADAGADAVKFQTFEPDALAAAGAPTAAYQRAAGEDGGQREMLARLALPAETWPALQAHARERGLVFLSTPFDDASAELLDRLDVPAFKVGSGELTNLPFLRRLAARGRAMLVSTGMAGMHEVAAAVDAIRAGGNPGLAIFHCVSAYPASVADANLRAMGTMRAAFGVPTGWSDHTPGIELPVAAVALGAAMIEKHLTLDAALPGPDHRASLEPAAFGALVAAVRAAESALGDGDKRPVEAELAVAAVARRSLHWAVSLPAGMRVEAGHLVALRPGTGIAPARLQEIVGRRTRVAVAAGAIVRPADVEGLE